MLIIGRKKACWRDRASVVLDNLKKIPTMSGQLTYIDSLDLTDKARTMYERLSFQEVIPLILQLKMAMLWLVSLPQWLPCRG